MKLFSLKTNRNKSVSQCVEGFADLINHTFIGIYFLFLLNLN